MNGKMEKFKLSNNINPNRIFILQKSEIEKRLDPFYYYEIFNNKIKFAYNSSKLSRIAKTYSGGTPSKEKQEYWNGNILWASPKDMKEFYLSDTEDKITEMGLKNSATTLAPQGSLLIVFRSGILQHTLPVAITTKDTTINQDLKVIIPNDDIFPEFLAVYFRVFQNRILPRIIKHSTTVQSINQEEFNSLPIPIPNKPIQKEIIDIHKRAIEQKQQKETQAQVLLASIDDYLLRELGITMPNENDVDEVVSYQGFELNKQNPLVKNGRLFLTGFKEIGGGRFDPVNSLYLGKKSKSAIYKNIPLGEIAVIEKGQSITREKITKGEYPVIAGGQISPYSHYKYNKEENTITISASGAYAGFVWYHDYPIFASDCSVIRSKKENAFSTKYIFEVLKSKQKEIYLLQKGAGQPHVYPADLAKIFIPNAPTNIQNIIIGHINSLRQQAQLLQKESMQILQQTKEQIEKMILE